VLKRLQNFIQEKYGIELDLKLFGENERNNVFIGEKHEEFYIVKLEAVQEERIELSINIAKKLFESKIIRSSRFLQSISGKEYELFEEKFITIQVKEDVRKLPTKSNDDIIRIGEAIGEFHLCLMNNNLKNVIKSDFYNDFMSGGILGFQEPKRLEQILEFYNRYSPDYEQLTKGVVHNDLNSNNIFMIEEKFFFIDFEHIKFGPLISDLGVFILELWDEKNGIRDYFNKIKYLVEGYERKIRLSEYDKDNIIIFSLRYLFSDENWYNYWYFNGNPSAIELIPSIKNKQSQLLKVIC
jgi:Ser/Thr protein kinase RdoA (MazF antagonist)